MRRLCYTLVLVSTLCLTGCVESQQKIDADSKTVQTTIDPQTNVLQEIETLKARLLVLTKKLNDQIIVKDQAGMVKTSQEMSTIGKQLLALSTKLASERGLLSSEQIDALAEVQRSIDILEKAGQKVKVQ